VRTFIYRCFLRYRLGMVLGTGFFAASLFLYRSFEQRVLWDRWSYQFLGVIALGLILFLVVLVAAWRGRDRRMPLANVFRSAALYLDLGILIWGVAYFIGAIDDPTNAALVTTLNVFGTISPLAACLQWVALVMVGIAVFVASYERLGKRWTKLIIPLAALAACVVVLEGVVRFRAVIAPVAWDYPIYSSILWERYYVKFNEQVFRDEDHSIERAPGVRRLLMIGDPFAFGWGIKSIGHRMDVLVGRELAEATGERWETINMSHGEKTTEDYIEYLRAAQRYRPDVVILLYAFNDMGYLCPPPPRREFYGFSLLSLLFRNSYLVQEVFVRLHYLRSRYPYTQSGVDPYNDASLLARHMEDLATFVAIGRDGGAVVMIVPFDIRLSLGDPFRARYERFVRAAMASNLPVLSLASILSAQPYSRLTTNRLNPHPNELANRIGADVIVQELLKEMRMTAPGTL
jgi:hypothetical protein